MKNYLAFFGRSFYPIGGMSDFIGSFEDVDEAVYTLNKEREKEDYDDWDMVWCHVYSIKDNKIVFEKG